jgi:hypothetical protein
VPSPDRHRRAALLLGTDTSPLRHTSRLWVPKTSVPSCDLLILVDQASEQADASHLLWWWSRGVFEPVGWSLAEGAVGPMSVVVRDVGIQDRGQVAAAENEDPVGAFAAEGADPAFGESVRAGGRVSACG